MGAGSIILLVMLQAHTTRSVMIRIIDKNHVPSQRNPIRRGGFPAGLRSLGGRGGCSESLPSGKGRGTASPREDKVSSPIPKSIHTSTLQQTVDKVGDYGIRPCTSHPPGAVFQDRLVDNQEGANAGLYVCGKLLARWFPSLTFSAPTLF